MVVQVFATRRYRVLSPSSVSTASLCERGALRRGKSCASLPHVASGALAPVLTDYPPHDAGLYLVRPPGDLPPRKVRVLTDILVESFGAGKPILAPADRERR